MDLLQLAGDLVIQFWQFTVVAILILIGFIINLFDKHDRTIVGFKYKEMPTLKPVRIPTKDKGFFSAIWMWIMGRRTWEVVKDFKFELSGNKYVIPKGFIFDGASIPKYFAMWLSPVGVLLIGGLVHDYLYRYALLLRQDKKTASGDFHQKDCDKIFRDINIEINGFFVLNYVAYFALRLGGWLAWNGLRKKNAKIPQLADKGFDSAPYDE